MIQKTADVAIRSLHVESKAFRDQGVIPRKYTCDGLNVSPPLDISFLPQSAVCLAVLAEDPDAPISTWLHWMAWNIPVSHHLPENLQRGLQGFNDFNKRYYCGPCPISGTHRYVFRVYALDTLLDVHPGIKKNEFLKAISDHIVAYGELTGTYTRASANASKLQHA